MMLQVCLGLALAGQPDPSAFVLEQMAGGNIPGLSAAVTVGGNLVWTAGLGSANPESGEQRYLATADTAFTFASVSKTITGVAVLMLREQGLLDVEADVNTYLPHQVARSGITTAQLMTHVSSITDDFYMSIPREELYVNGDPLIGLEEFNREMFTVGGRWYSNLTFVGSPGERFDYSNIGSSLAACVVEQVAIGASLAPDYNTFVREHIFAPLGVSPLGGSHYLRDFDGEMEPPLGALPSDFRGNSWESLPHYSVPDYPNGFWRSSSQTYAALLGMVANRGEWGGVRLLTEASIAYLEERAPAPNNGGRQGKAFFRYDNPESRVIGHDGGELGIATGAYLDLETLVGATVLTNGDWGQGSAFSDAIERIIVHLLEEFAPEGTTVSALPRLSEGADASRRIARSAAAAAAFPSR